ncbi:MAG: VOC family protein [Candidatus Bathyarchaeota archaeon]
MIKALDHVAITVKDLDKTLDWYVKNLGFSVGRKIENKERGIRIAFLEAGGHAMLEIFGLFDAAKTLDGPILKPEETGIKHISFFVDDMDGMCQRLKNVGVDFTTLTPERVVFKDLNGNVIEMRLS